MGRADARIAGHDPIDPALGDRYRGLLLRSRMRQFVSLRDGIAHGTVHAVSSSLTSRHWLDVHGAASPAAFSITSERVRLSSSCCDRMRVLETFEGRLDALGQVDGRLA